MKFAPLTLGAGEVADSPAAECDKGLCRLHALVRGMVQGVCFRAHTQERADGLGLSGYVRNLRDGRVEVVAEGGREALERLEGFLREGPPGAYVAEVEARWLPGEGGFEGFAVRF